MNSDLQRERKSATFDVEEFASWWYGGADKLRDRREIEADILSDPALKEELSETNLSYQETYDEAIKKCIASARTMQRIQAKRNPGGEEIFPELVSSPMAYAVLPEGTPLLLHYSMFAWTIKEQGTPDQVQKWLPRARKCNIIGTYAQTELGHGTFLRGLQTRADYDPASEEFVIHSPTITAYKWWPGGLGHTANYAIILAQLYIGDQQCGLQLFIVQLRDEETHMPLPGIIIGEIGNKMSFKTVNNGYVGFNKVRIPRLNMLMRNAQVLPDGTFNKSPASVLTYFTMVYMRAVIVSHSYMSLARTTTIAVRYSAVRREYDIDSSEPDKQIVDLLPQQIKLFPQIAKIVAFKLTADRIMEVFNALQQDFLKGEFERLPEIHALVCCLKAISTRDATIGAETLQQACAAHGNMLASSLPRFHALASASITYEGENTVMHLQTGRYLMKAWALALDGGNLVPTVAYMEQATKSEPFPKWDGSWTCLVGALQFVAANKIRLVYEHLEARKQKMSSQEAFNATSIEIAAASQVHGRAFLAATFLQQLTSKAAEKSEELNAVLYDLLELYLVNECLEHLADILRYISLSEDEVEQLQFRLETALAVIRPNAVAIVDGFDLHDLVLRSTLGCYDGNMYERIQGAADKCPMKRRVEEQSVRGYLNPIVKSSM